jgi:hypothetical protein
MPAAHPGSFECDEYPQHDRRHDYIEAEEAADRIRKQLRDHEWQIEAMVAQKRDQLR